MHSGKPAIIAVLVKNDNVQGLFPVRRARSRRRAQLPREIVDNLLTS
jgi:hypothetical protein